MRALLLVVGLVVTVVLVTVGVVLYGSPAFVGWALGMVALGAGLQFAIRRGGLPQRQDLERRETFGQVLRSGSFLRLYPPLPAAVAFVVMAVVVNTGPPSLVMVPLLVVMTCSAIWRRRASASARSAGRSGRDG
ncbi:hypothetical protein [Actinomadura sp. NPDC000600]|uniref:hypothetical protein n=1 Tax=Actinomadura sp. NPDC000600 TaxID=3154262 RepID=UPI0033982D30